MKVDLTNFIVPEEFVVESCVRLYLQALPKRVCQKIIDTFELDKEGQLPGKLSTKAVNQKIKKSIDVGIQDRIIEKPEYWKALDESIFKCVAKTWKKYRREVSSARYIGRNLADTGYQIQRYRKNKDYFKPHVDATCVDSCNRVMACILYLNDVLEGGETIFPELKIKIPCRTGSIVWFPANFTHVHQGTIPRSNDKYIISSFMIYTDET